MTTDSRTRGGEGGRADSRRRDRGRRSREVRAEFLGGAARGEARARTRGMRDEMSKADDASEKTNMGSESDARPRINTADFSARVEQTRRISADISRAILRRGRSERPPRADVGRDRSASLASLPGAARRATRRDRTSPPRSLAPSRPPAARPHTARPAVASRKLSTRADRCRSLAARAAPPPRSSRDPLRARPARAPARARRAHRRARRRRLLRPRRRPRAPPARFPRVALAGLAALSLAIAIPEPARAEDVFNAREQRKASPGRGARQGRGAGVRRTRRERRRDRAGAEQVRPRGRVQRTGRAHERRRGNGRRRDVRRRHLRSEGRPGDRARSGRDAAAPAPEPSPRNPPTWRPAGAVRHVRQVMRERGDRRSSRAGRAEKMRKCNT